MSPSRSRRLRRQKAPVVRTRRELVNAVSGPAVLIVVTSLLIWGMRPGRAFFPGTGGVLHRQPRISWLVTLALVALALQVWAVLRPASRIRKRELAIGGGSALIVVVTVVIGIVWPGGVVHHYISLTPASVATTSTTTRRSTTTTAPRTTPTTVATTTVAPSTTAAVTSTSQAGTTTSAP
jgi:hypothetical protein